MYYILHFFHLKLIVVDEVHIYSDHFGLATSLVLSRLRRIADFYCSNSFIQYIACSATLPIAKELASHLFSIPKKDIVSIEKDCSPVAKRYQVIWTTLENTTSKFEEASNLLYLLIKNGYKSICFCNTREACEITLHLARSKLKMKSLDDSLVESYRGGYSITERRRIEQLLFSNALSGVIATSALELGVDIGTFDAVLHVGFSSYSSYHQAMGRVGRRQNISVSFMIVDPSSAFAQNPNCLFHHQVEDVKISDSRASDKLLTVQLNCASIEHPISTIKDAQYFIQIADFEDCVKEKLRFDSHFNNLASDWINLAITSMLLFFD